MQYVGAFHNLLFNWFIKDDGLSIGGKLAQIEKTAGKRYFDMSDKEAMEAIEKVLTIDFSDEVYSDEDFKGWVEKH